MKNFQGTEGELRSEFSKFSPHSPNGHITIKAGDVGTPIAILPMPVGGEKQIAKQNANAQLLISSKKLYRELEHTVKALKIVNSMGATTSIIARAEAVLKEALAVLPSDAHLTWWKELSEQEKWNMTINHVRHWEDMDNDDILELYNKHN